MARVTSTLSIASAATLESLAEEMSTVQVEAIINQSVKNFYSPLPPSLFYGASASVIAAASNANGGPGPKTASKSKSPKSVADGPQYLLRFALLVAGTLEPKTLSPVDILAYGSRILSLVRSMPMSTILIYDDRYRRGIAPLIAGGTDLTLRQCYLSDSNPALLAEVVSYSVRSTSARRGMRGSSTSSRHPQRWEACRNFARASGPEAPALGAIGCCVTNSHVGKNPGEPAKQWSGHEITAHPSLKGHVEELHSSGLDLRRRKMDPRVFATAQGEIDEGLSLGVESPLKPSGVLPEAKSRAQ
ncbi:hypothetical protein FOZ63_031697, partial [Perkinsus olseni]